MSKVLICSRVHAEHHEAVKFNTELERLFKVREALVAKLKSEAVYVYSTLVKSYSYKVKDASSEPFLPASIRGSECVRLIKTWSNKVVFDTVARTFGHANGDSIPETSCSVVYYRMNGLLLHVAGTGQQQLKHNQPISDTEWSELREGSVPVKFSA